MRAVRLHAYGERPVVEEVAEPEITEPLDVTVRIGGAGACRAGDDMHCEANLFPGISTNGGFAELLKTNARAVVKLAPGVEPKDVAAHADAGLTAYHAVKKAADLLYPGTTAVVIGAGGLGHIGIQTLKVLTAASVIVVDRSEGSLELARECGADETVLADGKEVEAVRERTEGHGAEAVIDFVGEGGALEDGIAMLRDGGSHYVVGYGGVLSIPAIDIISTEVSFVGNLVGSYNDLAELMTLEAEGKVKLHTSSYPIDAANEAMDDLDEGRLHGRGILIP